MNINQASPIAASRVSRLCTVQRLHYCKIKLKLYCCIGFTIVLCFKLMHVTPPYKSCLHKVFCVRLWSDSLICVSGFHNAWNQRVQVAHPSLWVFIRHLKDVQTTTETDCARRGAPAQRPVRKWRVLNRKIKRLIRRYTIGTISLDRFWRHISYLVGTVRQ